MSRYTESKFACPACYIPLRLERLGTDGVSLWCGSGPCLDWTCSNGAAGPTEEAAFQILKEAFEEKEV